MVRATSSAGAGPMHLVFAVGGAGTHASRGCRLLEELRPWLNDGRLRVSLVAGVRRAVAARFEERVRTLGLDGRPDVVSVVYESDFDDYYHRFNQALESADLLWTKPSELVFYGALGLPVVLDEPVGDHECANRRWCRAQGVGIIGPPDGAVTSWLEGAPDRSELSAAAEMGAQRLEALGAHRISRTVLTAS